MQDTNRGKSLGCSSEYIQARWVENVSHLHVAEKTIVVNLGETPAKIKAAHHDPDHPDQTAILDALPAPIAPWQSTICRNVTIESASLLLLISTPFIEAPDAADSALAAFPQMGGGIDESLFLLNDPIRRQVLKKEKWLLYYDSVAEKDRQAILPWKYIPLFITPDTYKTCFGPVRFDPYRMTGQAGGSATPVEYYILSYVWFCPRQTNVGIHNQHQFIEIHTQISGLGRMQKFTDNDYTTLTDEFRMAPGVTNPPFHVVDPGNPQTYVYPWHQYYADSDCLWLVTEFHPASEFDPNAYA